MQELSVQLVQSQVPNVRDLTPLGRGGQKIVFKGLHANHGAVVVKLVIGAPQDERVKREIEVASRCCIPHTARLYECGGFDHCGGTICYILEEFVPGVTLRQHLADNGPLSTPAVLTLIQTLLETAVVMEKESIVHRDIKPENIMACPDGSYRLLDFGIARHLAKTSITPTEAHFGPHTAGYAAPEQFRNLKKKIDIRTDLFAIGVVTYEAISSSHPFSNGARDRLDILRRTEHLIPDALAIPGDSNGQLAGFITTLMSKYPSRRPPTAAAAKQWFDALMRDIRLKEA